MHEELKTLETIAEAPAKKPRVKRVRAGRPPLERAGKVEERILDAASKVFLQRGLTAPALI